MSKACPICSNKTQPWSTGLKSVYNHHELSEFCDSCTKKANSFLNYYGKKRKEDLKNLFNFVNCGDIPTRKFNAMMNGGYY